MSQSLDQTTVSSQPSEADKARPWWRYPIVWMVIGGPAAVVVASFFTMSRSWTPRLTTSRRPARPRLFKAAIRRPKKHCSQQIGDIPEWDCPLI